MLGSLTKAFTATAIGELVAEGKLDWDTTPVNTYLPEFETIDPVLTSQLTLQDLLSHRTVCCFQCCSKQICGHLECQQLNLLYRTKMLIRISLLST